MTTSIDLTQPVSVNPPRKGTGDERKRKPTADELLRKRGYRIHSRPAKGEAVWRDSDGKLWPQSKIVEE